MAFHAAQPSQAEATTAHNFPPYTPRLQFDVFDPAEVAEEDQDTSPLYGRVRGRYMNQSFISLLANVGSTASFNTQIDTEWRARNREANPLARSHFFHRGDGASLGRSSATNRGERNDGIHAASERKMLKSMPALPRPITRKKYKTSLKDAMTTSQILLPPAKNQEHYMDSNTQNSLMSGTSESRPTAQSLEQASTGPESLTADIEVSGDTDLNTNDVNLPDMLVQMFDLEEREELIAEYPCYLIQSSLLQGYMYIMQKHICFYAYLPKRTHTIMRSGFLLKRGRKNPKYNRYWFILKGDVLSYYTNASQLYFPRGTIDLRTAVSAQTIHANESETPHTSFTISTAQFDMLFKADSATSATEWAKQIQSAIFRLRNDGDSIKITLPVRNILDLEDNPVLDAADTFRFKVIDNDETFAVDEYFFAFFGCGPAALSDIRHVLDSNPTSMQKDDNSLEPVKEMGAVLDSPDVSVGATAEDMNRGSHVTAAERQLLSSITTTPTLAEEQQLSLADSISHSTNMKSATKLTQIDFEPQLAEKPKPSSKEGTDILSQDLSGLTVSRVLEEQNSNISRSSSTKEVSGHPQRPTMQHSTSYSKLQDVFRASAYPLHKASGIAGMLRTKSQRVGSLLASESVGYYEKAYNMWAGKRMHYDDGEGPASPALDQEHGENEVNRGDRFRAHFTLPVTEKLQATYYSYLYRIVPIYGKIYLGTSKICFRSLLPGTRTKMILPLKDIENVAQEKGFRFGYAGFVITIRGHEELFFEFRQSEARDDCAITTLGLVETVRHLQESRILSPEEKLSMEAAKTEHDLLQQARRNSQSISEGVLSMGNPEFANEEAHILFDDPYASFVNFKPPKSLKITCLTIGSRGDVQPFISLCKGLIAEGHHPTIATHSEFGDWVRGHGIDFAPVAGNPAEIMRLCVENDMFTISFLREAHTKFRGFIDDLLNTAWAACQGTDLLIESPSAMAGIHIAEALQIPYFRAFTMPWTRTRAFPHAFIVPTHKRGGNYNLMTYVMFDNLFWQGTASQINRWRKRTLGLPNTNFEKLQSDKVPFLYNFSPSVVGPPSDFNHWVHITGYWFLDEGAKHTPDPKLAEFIQEARRDGKKLVYVGFGSVVVDDPAELTRAVVEAVLLADVRCILSKGWSDRLGKETILKAEVALPDAIHPIRSAPHDWLFRQVDAAVHHGGAGTTGASIRAGIPTITKPFFGDQYFFGSRIEDLGVGICLSEITANTLAQALVTATTDRKMIERARLLGEQIRSEDGVGKAIQAIYRDLDYAKSLIKRRSAMADATDEMEENWTMVGIESDIEGARRTTGLQGPEFHSSLAQRRQSVTSGESALAQDDEASAGSSDGAESDGSSSEVENEAAEVEVEAEAETEAGR